MDFDWSDDQRAMRTHALTFAQEVLDLDSRPLTQPNHSGDGLPEENWRRLAEWGYFGLTVPAELGGGGTDPLTAVLVTEGLAEGCRDLGLLFSAAVQAWVVPAALVRFGSQRQQRRYLPGLIEGSTIGAFAVTEPDSGSDAFAMRTRARSATGGWVLTGRKSYITNGPVADLVVCFAAAGQGGLLGGVSAFLVETDTPGVQRGEPVEKMGLNTSPLGDIVLDEVFVPEEQLLGKPGRGVAVFNEVLDWERIGLAALNVGFLIRQLDEACRYAKQRESFGVPIGKHQAVAHRIAEMKVRLDAGRLLLYRAAWLKAHHMPATAETAMAKLWLSESAVQNSLENVEVHAAYGYMRESGVEGQVRDAIGSRITSGTSDMQRSLIARSLGL